MICILQARINSKRLPKKVMKKISSKFILERVINRIKKSKEIKKIIVATSSSIHDDAIASFCKKKKIFCFRSNLNNVYLRYYKLINIHKINSFVRITADSPLIDPKIIDKAIKIFKKKTIDIVTNTLKRSYPKGQSVEVINSKIILKNLKNVSNNKNDLEHITSYFYKNKNRFNILNISLKKNLSNLNVSIDTQKDYEFVKKIIKLSKDRFIGLNSILKFINKINKQAKK